jgi:GrpB-like predicted nucleotidyltransferase (UPF0157 family)
MEKVLFKSFSKVRSAAEKAFRFHKRKIRRLLPWSDIQHVGGTAVHGCITKGDLDIQVRVKKSDYAAAKTALLGHYQHLPGGWSARDGISFKDESRSPSVGIHLTFISGSCDVQWKFREVLKRRPDLCSAYDELKRNFQGKSMTSYRNAKTGFFRKLRYTREYRALRNESKRAADEF